MNKRNSHIYVFTILVLTTLLSMANSTKVEAHWAEKTLETFKDSEVIPSSFEVEQLDKEIKKGEIDKIFKVFYSSDETYFKVEQYNLTISREEACGLFCRVSNMDLQETEPSFDDADLISVWAKPYVATSQKAGVVVGYPDKTFKPQNHLTNAEFITMLSRVNGSGGISDPPPYDLIDETLEDIEVGIFMYSSGETMVEKIEDELRLVEGDQLTLSIALPEDASSKYKVLIDDENIVSFDETFSVLTAKAYGNTDVTFKTDDGKYDKTIKIFINQKEEVK